MKERSLNINADLGEGAGNDDQVMPFLHSCNIACGGHAGNESSIRKTILLAQQNNVKVGAHPGYPDKENFGRLTLDISRKSLQKSIEEQLSLFIQVCQEENIEIHHVKLHGALYNDTAKDKSCAISAIEVMRQFSEIRKLYVPFNSVIHHLAEAHFDLCFEGFMDRAYENDGTLRSRKLEGALIQEPREVYKQLAEMAYQNEVTTHQGLKIKLVADTYCIHGDHPNAVAILSYIDQKLRIN